MNKLHDTNSVSHDASSVSHKGGEQMPIVLRFFRGSATALAALTVFAAPTMAAFAVAGCQPNVAAPAANVTFSPMGYVVLVDGTIGVIDMLKVEKVQEIKIGNYGVHQVAVLNDNRTIYTGNRNDNTIVKLTISADGKSFTQKSLGKSPVNLHLFAASPEGADGQQRVVVTSRLELGDDELAVFPSSGLDDTSIAIIDTKTDTIIKTLPLQSPAMAAFPNDGKHLYVNNVHNGSVSVIDTATWTESARWNVSDTPIAALPNGKRTISPDGLDVSPDGKWVATADYDLKTITVWEAANSANKRKITLKDGEGLPHDVRFTPDSKQMWVTDYDKHPDPGKEAANNNIKTHIRVFDVATLTQVKLIDAPRKVQRISLPQYSKNAYFTTGVGGVLVLDRETGTLQGEVVIGDVNRPVVCGMTSY